MQLLSFDRSTTAQTAGITLATVAALALLALVGAHWTWQWLAPDSVSRAPTTSNEIGHAASSGSLFGSVDRESTSAPSGIEVKLLGVVAATAGGREYAVLRIEPRQIITVAKGDEIVPGVRLADIAADHVVLERGGIRETLSWPVRPMATAVPGLRVER